MNTTRSETLTFGFFRFLGSTPVIALGLALVLTSGAMLAQPEDDSTPGDDEEIETLSPFKVDASSDSGYYASNTLAGTRIHTNLEDIGTAIQVLTPEFLQDIGAVDNTGALAYATNTEVGGPRGNFSGAQVGSVVNEADNFLSPNTNTRIRGLAAADNTRNYFRTDVPWDGYAVDRVDLLRGANGIMFGLGSPAGVVNAGLISPVFENIGRAELMFDFYGSIRGSLDYNREVIEDELAVRVAGLADRQRYQQNPAYENDDRLYVAATWEPKFLNKNQLYTSFSANVEFGSITSNHPRFVTPHDRFTPWFDPAHEGGWFTTNSNTASRDSNSVNDDPPLPDNLAFKPFVQGDFISINNVVWVYDRNGPIDVLSAGIETTGSLNPDGTVNDAIEPNTIMASDTFPVVIADYPTYARFMGFPFGDSGLYVQRGLRDDNIFNFYKVLMDGDNKEENMDWTTYELGFSQTYLDGKFGLNANFFSQNWEGGVNSVISGRADLAVEMNETVYPEDAISSDPNWPQGLVPSADLLNPNLGRAYFAAETVGNSFNSTIDRKAWRIQAIASHDFNESRDGNWLWKLLGNHRVTGAVMYEDEFSDRRNFYSHGWDEASREALTGDNRIDSQANRTAFRYYLTPDLRGTPLNQISLTGIQHKIFPETGGPISVEHYIPSWMPQTNPATGMPYGPGDVFDNNQFRHRRDIDINGVAGRWGFQSMNPANYLGRVRSNMNLLVASDGQASQDALTMEAQLSFSEIDSQVLVYQGYFWNDALVFTYGYRKDDAVAGTHTPSRVDSNGNETNQINDDNTINLSSSAYNFDVPERRELKATSNNYSGVIHINRLWEDREIPFIPLNVGLFYNNGTNFQPAAERVDAFGDPLAPPKGETEDYGILLSTPDNKYSLRLTKYETKISNATSTFPDLDANMFWFGFTIASPSESRGLFLDPNSGWLIEDHPDPDRLRDVIIPAWEQFETDLEATFPKFVQSWVRGPWNPAHTDDSQIGPPDGHAYTEDSVSKGYEVELVANPTRNWRLAVNYSQTEAIRDNVPGNISELFDFVRHYVEETPAGEMPVWWVQSPGVAVNIWPNVSGFLLKVDALNGQTQPEIRKHRLNAVTNYNFTEGKLRGFGVGGAYRYQSSSVIAYEPQIDDQGNTVIDIDKNFSDDPLNIFDLWFSYDLPWFDDTVSTSLQFNVFNAFGENKLVPLNAQPDGSYGAFRIQEGRSYQLTARFEF